MKAYEQSYGCLRSSDKGIHESGEMDRTNQIRWRTGVDTEDTFLRRGLGNHNKWFNSYGDTSWRRGRFAYTILVP